jgi:UDP-glucose 4-epimerase
MSTYEHALVTGGAGFIGHHLVHSLLGRGLSVTVLDDLSVGMRANVPAGATFIEGDVRDPGTVAQALAGVDCVFHLAAIVSIRASVDGFLRDADVNLMGTLNLLEALRGRGVRKAVLASSMAVYADSPRPVPVPESYLTAPISPYGVAKLAAEQYWLLIGSSFGVGPTVLRFFNTYGPGQTPTPYVGVITIFVERLLAGKSPVVYGDGEQRRDFVHVDDIVAATVLALEHETPGAVFNVGSGRPTSVNEIATALIRELTPGMKPENAAAPPGEMRNAIADISLIREALGYEPSRPAVDFADVIAYMRDEPQ